VLVDYNQNAWGRTLASVYSVRPVPEASVSTPVTWAESERGIEIADFTIRTVPGRLAKAGDLWKPILAARGRFRLEALL
jgi:Predicted eukaryotic-type DNA primase